jgi:hypothetical protein
VVFSAHDLSDAGRIFLLYVLRYPQLSGLAEMAAGHSYRSQYHHPLLQLDFQRLITPFSSLILKKIQAKCFSLDGVKFPDIAVTKRQGPDLSGFDVRDDKEGSD